MSIYDNNKELLSTLGVEGNYSTDFEVRKAILNALGGDASMCNSIYEVDLQILKIYQEGGGSGSGKWKVPDGVLFCNSDWEEIPGELDFSERETYSIGGYGCFQNNYLLKSINHPLNGHHWVNAFSDCSGLTTISSIDITDAGISIQLSDIFYNCQALSNINFIGSINTDIDFGSCIKLTYESIKSILTACSNTTNTNSKTVTFKRTLTDQNSELVDLIATCNSKGWTISGLTLE